MISRELATMEVQRLSGLDYFPRTTEGVNELVGAIREAQNELQAHATITEFSQGERECPKPADINRVLQQLKKPVTRKNCGFCGGTGFVVARCKYSGDRLDLKQLYGDREIEYSEPCKACA